MTVKWASVAAVLTANLKNGGERRGEGCRCVRRMRRRLVYMDISIIVVVVVVVVVVIIIIIIIITI
jgi:hypothetical protein